MPPIRLITVLAVLLLPATVHAGRLLIFDDSTHNELAAGHISSGDATGWDDATLFVGDVASTRYHLLIAIKDTAKFQSYFEHCTLDSAKLSLHVLNTFGAPGNLNLHMIRRDSTGTGVYPAYDDSRFVYCRTLWHNRKGAYPLVCPDSIPWQTSGALGPQDSDSIPFATLTSPAAGMRHDIDVTAWIDGLIRGVDSVSNGIMLRASASDGAGSDFISIRSIRPFFTGDQRLMLKVWVSDYDWVTVRLDSNRVHDLWITDTLPGSHVTGGGYIKSGTGNGSPLQSEVAIIFPHDSTLHGPDAIPERSTIDSARLWLYLTNTFTAPNDTIAVGEIIPATEFVWGRLPSWDSASESLTWTDGSWSTDDAARRDARFVNAVNAWYSWSIGAAIQRWVDSGQTRNGLVLWDAGPNTGADAGWADRTQMAYNAKAGSLKVWFTPPVLPTLRRPAWLDSPSPLK